MISFHVNWSCFFFPLTSLVPNAQFLIFLQSLHDIDTPSGGHAIAIFKPIFAAASFAKGSARFYFIYAFFFPLLQQERDESASKKEKSKR